MTSFLLALHRADAYLAIALMLVAAVHGLAGHRRHPTVISRQYRNVLLAGAAILAFQVVIGLSMLAGGLRPSTIVHIIIYGALSPLILPGAYFYVRGRGKSHPNMAFALVSLFLFAFLIRGLFTG
ncbi:MAG: hypothetical protein HY681_11280 [Chloroflexi bacterium]|nr:hypothetical protein [Chloroflexota bacterium]